MLTYGFLCDEAMNMAPEEQRALARSSEEDLQDLADARADCAARFPLRIRSAPADRAVRQVSPMSKGSGSHQLTYARTTRLRSKRPAVTSVLARASAVSESLVGWPGIVPQVPPSPVTARPPGVAGGSAPAPGTRPGSPQRRSHQLADQSALRPAGHDGGDHASARHDFLPIGLPLVATTTCAPACETVLSSSALSPTGHTECTAAKHSPATLTQRALQPPTFRRANRRPTASQLRRLPPPICAEVCT
jgi:hypothetical protein